MNRLSFRGETLTDGNLELYLLVDCRICIEEAECNSRRGQSIILNVLGYDS